MKRENQLTYKGIIYVLLSATCFSLGGILIKMIPWNSFSINSIRAALSFLVILIFMKYQKRKFVWNTMVMFGAFLNFVMGLTFVLATKMTTAGNAIVLQFTEPVFLILYLWVFYKKKPKKDAVITCTIVLSGILCFFFESLSVGGMLGNLLAIISGMTYAGVFLMKRFPGGDFESSLLVSHIMSVIVGCPFVLKESEFNGQIIVCLLLLGIVQFGLSYVFLSLGLDIVSPVTASLTSTIEPILNPIIVAIFCGETLGMLSIIGAILVIGASTWYNYNTSHNVNDTK